MLTQHYLSFLVITVLQLLSLTKWFFIQISILHDNISSQVGDERRWGFGQWMSSSIIHDNICSLIHKNCHPKSYHIDIKYHMILNITFSVSLFVTSCQFSLFIALINAKELTFHKVSQRGTKSWILSSFENTFYEELVSLLCMRA